jgi:hypothetical protein
MLVTSKILLFVLMLLSFWKDMCDKYEELGVAALVLGKPTHNAFKERVFIRGTYTNTKLKKCIQQDTFEMSVLNAVNNKVVDDIDSVFNSIYTKMEDNKTKQQIQLAKFRKLEEHKKLS